MRSLYEKIKLSFAYKWERTLSLPLIIMLDTCKSVFSRIASQAHVSVPSLCFWEQSLAYQDPFHHSFGNQIWQSQHLLPGIVCFSQFTYLSQITPVAVTLQQKGLPRRLSGKESARQCWRFSRVGSIPGSGRCPGGGNGNPLLYSCLENPMDRGAWWAAQSMGSQRVRHGWADRACTHACPHATEALNNDSLRQYFHCLSVLWWDPQNCQQIDCLQKEVRIWAQRFISLCGPDEEQITEPNIFLTKHLWYFESVLPKEGQEPAFGTARGNTSLWRAQ